MLKQNIINAFINSCYIKSEASGKRVLKNDLVEELNINQEETTVEVYSNVISEELFNTYKAQFVIDYNALKVVSTKCTCLDFEKSKKTNYVCKHIYALMLKFIENLDTLSMQDKSYNQKSYKRKPCIMDFLIDDSKNLLKLESFINKDEWSNKISIEFKIGNEVDNLNLMYSIRDINLFILNKYNNIPMKFGKGLTFQDDLFSFSDKDTEILNFISMLQEYDYSLGNYKKSQEKFVNGKELRIPKFLLKQFLKIFVGEHIYLNKGFYSRVIISEVISGDIPLPIDVIDKNGLTIDFIDGLPEELLEGSNVFIYKSNIYLPSQNQINMLKKFIKLAAETKKIIIDKGEKDSAYKHLIPKLMSFSKYLHLDNTVKKNILFGNPIYKFYFDRDGSTTVLKINVCYDNYEFNIFENIKGKYIYNNLDSVKHIVDQIEGYGFTKIDNNFVFTNSEYEQYDFFKNKINDLQRLGEIFYTDNFKPLLNLNDKIEINVGHGRQDYIEMKYEFKDIDEVEYKSIIESIINHNKFYKLNSGEFIDLEEIEIKELICFLNAVTPFKDDINKNKIEVPSSYGYFIKNKLNTFTNTTSKEFLSFYKNKSNCDNELNFESINATLREYQIFGVKWLIEKYNLKLGGILADEMGLGKTLQIIALLILKRPIKTLIVSPTSLIYNWQNEIIKFAPNLNYKVIAGSKSERCDLIKNIKSNEVIITSYNSLRIDKDLYENLKFDLLVLDEAQYIKNPSSLTARTCKSLNANCKFALTGTPIENNLLDLWSIFDFILPGYLFSKEDFNVKYNRNLNEDECIKDELNNLITPFILRRTKNEVLKDLPPKIEKTLTVKMTKEQEKIYLSYSKYVTSIIKKEMKEDTFGKNKIKMLSYLTKLRQISISPKLTINSYTSDSAKFRAAYDLIIKSIENNKKILVFSQFTTALKEFSNLLQKKSINFFYLDGKTKASDRIELVNSFNSESKCNVFLISLKAGGTGLNLTSANVVIHLDPWWNPSVENQANDRAHRFGQKEPVEIIKIVSKDTIEEKVLNLQNQKNMLIKSILENGNLSNEYLSSLSNEDFLKMFEG
ncbi:MAG: DEAD/DEAH box helicase [Clostridium chrysemydis]|uniref:DEAD/DEAH box helicase n=1 Tax=Clostridium chrysemydis TaxID=2665504 RepID=UPI003F2C9513